MSPNGPSREPGEPVTPRCHPIPIDTTPYATYTGPSMNPTLREPELVEVVPYVDRIARPGDVVLFRSPDGGRPVVHRVTRITEDGIHTRGDNNSFEDVYTLQPSHIRGRVIAAWRGGRCRPIPGGWVGRMHRRVGRGRAMLDRCLSPLLRPVYRTLARCGVVRALIPARPKPRVVAFHTKRGLLTRVLIGARVVGRYDAVQQRWHIDPPFRLWVDESKLPKSP